MKWKKLIAIILGMSGLVIADFDHIFFNRLYFHSIYFVFFVLFLGFGFIIFGGENE